MATFRIELNDFLSDYINKQTHETSGYISSGDFIRELLRDHIRNNSNTLAVNQSYDVLTSKQMTIIGQAAQRGTNEYERITAAMLNKNPGLGHAISEIDYEMRQLAAEND